MKRKFVYFVGILLIINMNTMYSAEVSSQKQSPAFTYDTARIYNAMAKARRGEDVVVGFLGGSITQGFAASSEDKRWVNLVTGWWKRTFPKSKITLVNAGIGGTGSDICTFRLKNDILSTRPDFIIFEFAVNEGQNEFPTAMMEGIVRQLLLDSNNPGIMMLCLRDEKGMTAQPYHLPVAKHYKIPMVSFADRIEAQVKKDGVTMHQLYSDGLHPVDLGMQYIAQFITDELNIIYKNLPDDNLLPIINTEIPAPLTTSLYANTTKYNSSNLAPELNTGWKKENNSWVATEPGSELVFGISGNAIAIQYTRFNTPDRGKAEVWVDNGKHIVLDAYWTENWGPGNMFKLLGDSFDNREHKLHVKITGENSEGSKGHYFQLLNVLTAENRPMPDHKLNFYDAANKNFQYTGRIDFANPQKPRLLTPGSYIAAKFTGTSCEIVVNDEVLWGTSYNYLEVVIDDTIQKRIQTTGKYNVIAVADNLPDREHTILICKNTEVNIGYIEFLGLRCKELLPAPPKQTRKIEFIGNSITCGTGSDLSKVKCGAGQWHDQHNAYMAYGPVIARKLNAQWHLSSYSGIGLMHSCCDLNFTMPEVFGLLYLKPGSPVWDFTRYIPDLVTICLGQNDGIQDSVAFCNAYVKFIRQIRSHYPNAQIVCLTSPMGDDKLTAVMKNYLTGIVDFINSNGDKKVTRFFFTKQYNTGCDSHPDLKEHQDIADELAPFLRRLMGW